MREYNLMTSEELNALKWGYLYQLEQGIKRFKNASFPIAPLNHTSIPNNAIKFFDCLEKIEEERKNK